MREQEVTSLSDADSELSGLINEIGISDTANSVVVKTTNVAAAEQRKTVNDTTGRRTQIIGALNASLMGNLHIITGP
jgi:hypothetical protein